LGPDSKKLRSAGFGDFSNSKLGFIAFRPIFKDFRLDYKDFRPDIRDFTLDFKDFGTDFRDFTSGFKNFKPDFRDFTLQGSQDGFLVGFRNICTPDFRSSWPLGTTSKNLLSEHERNLLLEER